MRAEGEEPAIAVLDHKFARVPGRVANASCELDSAGGKLGVQRVRVFDQQVGVEQLVGVFVGIGRGRSGEAEMNSVLVARDDGIDRRVTPSAETFEAKFLRGYASVARRSVVKNWGAIWRIIGLNIPSP